MGYYYGGVYGISVSTVVVIGLYLLLTGALGKAPNL